eukprot:TRINITY_DN8503_c0_g1_i2.p1 TRINITY_DN8503_c0_g1~~TRINITY_DN8503_c0_g1_i2.p1  ORF type:complete len:832 (-),score=192.70 TRINITY_DN8503_c0_g1_i2:98-2548(-)
MGAQSSSIEEAETSRGCCSASDPDAVSDFRPVQESRGFLGLGCWSDVSCSCRRGDLQEVDLSSASVIREAADETEENLPQIQPIKIQAYAGKSSSSSSTAPAPIIIEPKAPKTAKATLRPDSPSGASTLGSWFAEGGSYKSCASLAKSLSDGHAVLVWGSWLAELAKKKGAVFPRRQELPSEAICNPDEVAAGKPLLAVSYCWATCSHPDPEGEQLQLVAALLERWLKWRRQQRKRRRRSLGKIASPGFCGQEEDLSEDEDLQGEGEDHGQEEEEGELGELSTGSDVAVLIDWCGLYQEPRLPEERVSFEQTLRQVGRWFSHYHTSVWLLTNAPVGADPFSLRGWTTFERAVSLLPAGEKQVLDIGLLEGDGTKGNWKLQLKGLDWPGVMQRCRAQRQPPLAPTDFVKEIGRKHFSWGRDRIVLEDRYREIFQDLVGLACDMPLARQNWGDQEVSRLQTTLLSCKRLQRLDLCHNRIGDPGAAKLAGVLLQCPRLLQSLLLLDLSKNEIGDMGASSLAETLPSLRHIQSLGLDSNFIGDEGACRLAGALPCCTGLQQLILGRNEIGDPGAGELALAMPHCTSLQLVDLSENEVSDIGAERLAAVLPQCGTLQRFDLARNFVGDRGALRLAATLPNCPQLQDFGLGGGEVGEILGGGRIGDDGAGLLASALLRCEHLCRLDLSENQIGDCGTAQLAAAMPHCGRLAELDLCRNRIADSGAGRLAEAVPRCGHLDWLRLLGNPLGDGGERCLVEAWQAAGKPKGRLLCRPHANSNRGGDGYGGWATWGSPAVAPESATEQGSKDANAAEDSSLHRTSL